MICHWVWVRGHKVQPVSFSVMPLVEFSSIIIFCLDCIVVGDGSATESTSDLRSGPQYSSDLKVSGKDCPRPNNGE